MLKTTSLVAAIPLSIDLYGVSRGISAVTFTPVPLLIVASIWYLLFTSVLMVGQHFIEKRFSRGTGGGKRARRRTWTPRWRLLRRRRSATKSEARDEHNSQWCRRTGYPRASVPTTF